MCGVVRLRSSGTTALIRDIHWIISQFPRPGLAGYLSAKAWCPQTGPVICCQCEPTGAYPGNSGRRLYRGEAQVLCFDLVFGSKSSSEC